VRLVLAPGAVVEWVPDHTIPSPGAALRQSIDVEVGEGATLFAVDAFAAGRVARDEAWRFALLDSTLTVRDRAGLLLHDRTRLTSGDGWRGLGFTEGRPYVATVVVVAEACGLDAFIAGLPSARPAGGCAVAGAARLARRGALVRCLAGDAPALVGTLARIWRLARATLLGAPPLDLRKG
jgi:urease accessory protein